MDSKRATRIGLNVSHRCDVCAMTDGDLVHMGNENTKDNMMMMMTKCVYTLKQLINTALSKF